MDAQDAADIAHFARMVPRERTAPEAREMTARMRAAGTIEYASDHHGGACWQITDAAKVEAVRHHVTRSERPQTAMGIAIDTGVNVGTVERAVAAMGARRHPKRDRTPRTIHTAAVRWSMPSE